MNSLPKVSLTTIILIIIGVFCFCNSISAQDLQVKFTERPIPGVPLKKGQVASIHKDSSLTTEIESKMILKGESDKVNKNNDSTIKQRFNKTILPEKVGFFPIPVSTHKIQAKFEKGKNAKAKKAIIKSLKSKSQSETQIEANKGAISSNRKETKVYWEAPNQLPNLIADYTPSGWDAPIVASSEPGTQTDGPNLQGGATTYIDFAFVNRDADIPSSTRFYIYLYSDGSYLYGWYWDGLQKDYYGYVEDYEHTFYTSGYVTLETRVDPTNVATESNESDNIYQRSVGPFQTSYPNLIADYTPSGWDAPMVASSEPGTRTDGPNLQGGANTYIDFAFVNRNADIPSSTRFYAYLYSDGSYLQGWYWDGIQANYYGYLEDFVYTFTEGDHTLMTEIDPTDVVTESNESDNAYQRTLNWAPQGEPDIDVQPISMTINQSQSAGSNINNYNSIPPENMPKIRRIDEKYIVRTFIDDDGNEIMEVIVPGKPPENFRAPVAFINKSAVTLPDMPAYDWSFGCSATSAAMMSGYYDNNGYANIYTGPTNGGIMPMDNSVWGDVVINGETRHQCPLSATRNGLDGRTIRGHVDDYWHSYGDSGPDPFIINSWIEHTWGECTSDYMGTSQSSWDNADGSTRFYYNLNGSALHDYTACETGSPPRKDGCHGMREFFESRGYTVLDNYTQLIYGYDGNTLGFTFNQFKQEINAGRPVMIQVEGHSMVGYGYDDSGNTIYIHDTWDYSHHTMTWGGSYSGMQHYAVTVVELEAVNGSNTFTISNVGNADLTITLISDDRNWLLTSGYPSIPFVITPGNNQVVNVSVDWNLISTSDQGVITIDSDDPDEPSVTVMVTANPLQVPPVPILSSPSNGATDQPTTLMLVWNSSSGATSYQLQVDDDANFGSPNYDQSGLTSTSQQVSGLSNGTIYYWRVNASNAKGTSPWSSEWYFTTVHDGGLNHFTDVVAPTGRTQPVYITDATLDGIQLEAGDEVGVFDGTLLVGAGKIVNLPMGDPIIVYLEYMPPGVDPLPGAHDGNDMKFKVWDQSADAEYPAEISEVVSGTPVFTEGAIVALKLAALSTITQDITIHPNKLNLISFYVSPENLDAASVFDPLPNFVIAQDDNGNVRVPPDVVFPGHPGTNTIGNIDITKGYSVYISGDNRQILQAMGMPIDLNNTPISLAPNKLNKIVFPSQSPILIVNVFSSTVNQHVYNDLVVVSDDNGNYYIPPNVVFPGHPGTNTIGDMQPGKGYNLYHNNASTLIFNYPDVGGATSLAKAKTDEQMAIVEHFSYEKTGESHPVFLRNSGLEFEAGDELAIFADDHCVGAMKYDGNLDDPLVIWQALPQYDLVGVKNGDELFVRHWSSQSRTTEDILIKGDVQFDSKRPFSILSINSQTQSEAVQQHVGVIPVKMALLQNYPNPFNPSTTIEFNISTPSKVSLVIYNIQGEVVVTLADGFLSPGVYTISWDGRTDDGTSVPGGVYFYKLKSGSFEAVRKMIYVK